MEKKWKMEKKTVQQPGGLDGQSVRLPGFTEFSNGNQFFLVPVPGLPGFTGFYWVLPDFTRFLPGFTEVY